MHDAAIATKANFFGVFGQLTQDHPTTVSRNRFVLIYKCYGAQIAWRVLLILCLCTVVWKPAVAETVSLKSGAELHVESTGKIYTAKDGKWTFSLKYVTKTPLTDVDAIHKEADEFWAEYVRELAESSGLESAVLIAHNKRAPEFGVSLRDTWGTVYLKSAAGWRRHQ